MISTQFASIFARRMFPCFDEPALKATFTVTVLRKEPMISLSNMNLVRNETRSVNGLSLGETMLHSLNTQRVESNKTSFVF